MKLQKKISDGYGLAGFVFGIGSALAVAASLNSLYHIDPSKPQQWIAVGLGLCLAGALAWVAKMAVVEP